MSDVLPVIAPPSVQRKLFLVDSGWLIAFATALLIEAGKTPDGHLSGARLSG